MKNLLLKLRPYRGQLIVWNLFLFQIMLYFIMPGGIVIVYELLVIAGIFMTILVGGLLYSIGNLIQESFF